MFAASAASAQGLILEVGRGAAAEVKAYGRTEWETVQSARRSVGEGDLLNVTRGPVRICLAGGPCRRAHLGEQPMEAPPCGFFCETWAQIRRVAGASSDRDSRTTTGVFAARSGNEDRPLVPPALLLPGDGREWRVLPEAFRLLWLPGVPANSNTPHLAARVRVYRDAELAPCRGGTLALDTLVTTGPIDLLDHPDLFQGGVRYRVALASDEGTDDGCFTAATQDEAEALRTRVGEVYRELTVATPPSDWSTLDGGLAVVGLFLEEGYPYNALVALDNAFRDVPDTYARTLWAQLLESTGVLHDTPSP